MRELLIIYDNAGNNMVQRVVITKKCVIFEAKF